jgi:hypothetical protein
MHYDKTKILNKRSEFMKNMTEGKPINTTTDYPLDIYGATFYYKVEENSMVTVYSRCWEDVKGTGKTIQEAVSEVLRTVTETSYQYELVDDGFRNWLKKVRNRI